METESPLIAKHNIALAELKDTIARMVNDGSYEIDVLNTTIDKFMLSSPVLQNLIGCRDALRAVASSNKARKEEVKQALKIHKLNLKHIDDLVNGIASDSLVAELEILQEEQATLDADISRMAQLAIQYDNVTVPAGLTDRIVAVRSRINEIKNILGIAE